VGTCAWLASPVNRHYRVADERCIRHIQSSSKRKRPGLSNKSPLLSNGAPLLLVAFLCTSLAGCSLTSLFDSDDEPGNGNNPPGEAPSYIGAYVGSMNVFDLQTDDEWLDRPATLEVTFDDLTGNVDLSISISDLPGGTKEIEADSCSPGPSTVFCSNVIGSTLFDLEFSFTSSSASGRILESERQADDTFEAVFEAEGPFTEQ
jgi:hypothetical protein